MSTPHYRDKERDALIKSGALDEAASNAPKLDLSIKEGEKISIKLPVSLCIQSSHYRSHCSKNIPLPPLGYLHSSWLMFVSFLSLLLHPHTNSQEREVEREKDVHPIQRLGVSSSSFFLPLHSSITANLISSSLPLVCMYI